MTHNNLLIALRIKGFAKPEILAACLGSDIDSVTRALVELAAQALVTQTKIGPKLTREGQAAADAASAEERLAADPSVITSAYDRFNAINGPFKALIADWQTREVDGALQPNDHTDTEYDGAVLARLSGLHRDVLAVCSQLTNLAPRFAQYGRRFESATAKIEAGEARYVAAPIIDSYHTVWFELHEDLIRLSGKTRAEEADAGRAV